jgi:hypothetical protein
MHVDMVPPEVMTPEQRRQFELYDMVHPWLAAPYPRNMRAMLTGDLVQEYEGLQQTLRELFFSELIDEEMAGPFTLALTKQMCDIEAELHRRIYIAKTAPASLKPLLPQEIVQAVKAAADIVDVFERRGTALRKTGKTWKGLCPFHDDHTPSLTVYPQTQTFYCFGCHLGGDAIEVVKLLDNVSFSDAVRRLGQDYGVAVPQWNHKERAAAIARKHT